MKTIILKDKYNDGISLEVTGGGDSVWLNVYDNGKYVVFFAASRDSWRDFAVDILTNVYKEQLVG